jgi:hypothetical protein
MVVAGRAAPLGLDHEAGRGLAIGHQHLTADLDLLQEPRDERLVRLVRLKIRRIRIVVFRTPGQEPERAS